MRHRRRRAQRRAMIPDAVISRVGRALGVRQSHVAIIDR
ncbi:hypothetical protein C731_2847 [Mycolicibacterium hassiacum DSM 44199]|uniref:Uncharacterized protein n=1 Tax=Mycolicibacterium hassiacum (strain DSM 44199 / CIP 105218 / JCM 12690 / 3849) TaxID=1122247 RepID=K5BFH5_MYCHD|nr:hypothetical protein C731_2847 [Mycolicibacterium hassiacum DSM 44199]